MSDVPIDDLLLPDTTPAKETDPAQAYDGGWEEAVDEGDGEPAHVAWGDGQVMGYEGDTVTVFRRRGLQDSRP